MAKKEAEKVEKKFEKKDEIQETKVKTKFGEVLKPKFQGSSEKGPFKK